MSNIINNNILPLISTN